MQLSIQRLSSMMVAVLVLGACGGGSDATGPGGGGGGGGGGGAAGSVSGTVQGQSWTADANQVFTSHGSVPGSLTIQATKLVSSTNYTNVTLTLGFIGGPGTYPIGVNAATTPGATGIVLIASGSTPNTWITSLTGAAGTITITSLTSTRIAGTFSFTADAETGTSTTGTATVSNGVFDVALPSGFTSVPAANHGSTLTATLGGAAFTAATVVGTGSGGAFSIGGLTTTTSVNLIAVALADTVGTYALGNSGIRVTVLDIASTHFWGGLPGDSGTVVITSLANGRAIGTFSGTLGPGATSPGALTVSGGAFDIRVDAP